MTTEAVPARWIAFGLRFFAATGVVAFAVAVLGPMSVIRFFGYVALTCALVGLTLHLYLLRDADPHAWMVLRQGVSGFAERARLRLRAALQRHDLQEVRQ